MLARLLKQVFFLCVLFLLANGRVMAAALQVVRITPQGINVPEPGQVIIEFDQPMVKGGQKADANLPIHISPAVKGEWQWLNDKTLSFNVSQDQGFHKATKYLILIQPTLKSLANNSLEKEIKHEFVTSLPSPRGFYFKNWQSPTRPVLRGGFDQKVTKESLEKHLFFLSKKDKTTKTAVVVTADELDKPGNPQADLKVSKYWVIEAAQDLEANQDYQLYLEPGLMAENATQGSDFDGSLMDIKTFGDFKFIGFRCRLNCAEEGAKPSVFTDKNPQKDTQKCNPLAPIELLFTAPVPRSQLKNYITLVPDPTAGNREVNIWGEDPEMSRLEMDPPADHLYSVRLPHGLKAATNYKIATHNRVTSTWDKVEQKIMSFFQSEPPASLSDEFGRVLENPFQITLKLDHRKPNFVIAHRQAVLEKNADSDVPLYVNNLKSATFTYQALTAHTALKQQVMTYTLPDVKDVQYAIPFNVRGMLNGQSGIVYGMLATNPEVDKGSEDGQEKTLFAQVTPYQVQVKMGPFNTLVWVTDLATGKVVKGAKVILSSGGIHHLEKPKTVLTAGITNEEGVVILDGQEKIDPKNEMAYAWRKNDNRMLVWVEKDDNIALLPLTYSFEIDTYRASGEKFWSNIHQKYQYLASWGTTAQGIYRAGDTVQYKIYIRNQDNHRFILPPKGKYDLEITDPTNKVVHEVKNISLNEFGAFAGEVKIPKNGAVGWYRFEIKAYFPDAGEEKVDPKTGAKLPPSPTCVLSPLQVLISDFTPAPFKVTMDINGDTFYPQQDLTLTATAMLHGGGAYTDAKAEIVAVLQPEVFHSSHPLIENFFFGQLKSENKEIMLIKKEGVVDNKGEYELKLPLTTQPVFYGKIMVEGKVTDDRGKSIAANKSVKYMGGIRLVGLKPKQWVFAAKKPAVIEAAVVDEKGNPVAGSLTIKVEKKETAVAKVKTAGNVYKTSATHEWQEVAGQTLECGTEPVVYQFIPQAAGNYKITAVTRDDQHRSYTCEMEVYVAGSDFVAWGEENDTYLPLIPEKKSYKVGETARFLVKNPYPGATALVTVERLGVMDQFVQTLATTSSFIEIPVKADYLPNFYVSVTAFSPRSGAGPQELGHLDLNKPAFRMGYAKINVKDHYKEIVVTAKAEKENYKPRDKVKVELTAALKHPGASSEPMELAVVVIDEAVFDLLIKGKQYYDPYQGFYNEETLGIRNFSLLNGLVGRMKFEKKGANPGGGGGGFDLNMRNVFKFVSYWNPSLVLDASGKTTIEFEAPDNLSGWKVLAIAMTPTDRMGLGEGSFKVNKPTEIRPVMPNQVIAEDHFKAGFSVMNRTQKTRQINVFIEAQGPLADEKAVYQETITLEPFKRSTLFMPLQTTSSGRPNALPLTFRVKAGDVSDEDQLVHTVPVRMPQATETIALSGAMEGGEKIIPLSIPQDIYTNPTGIQVSLAPSLITNFSGIFQYMKDYPYSCWEQKISRAVVASYYQDLKAYLGDEAQWRDANQFVKDILEDAASFQAEGGGMAYYKPKPDYVDPFLSAYTALSFAWLKEQGYTPPKTVEEALIGYLENLLKQPFTENHYTPSMVANTRAVILEALSYNKKITLADLERFLPFVKEMNAYGKSCFVRAALKIDGAAGLAEQVIKELFSHFNETSDHINLAETTGSERMLDSSLRATCATLETFTRFAQTPNGEKLIGDKAIKLAKSIRHAQKNKDHWPNTQENLYCARALASYRQMYEKESPHMQVTVTKTDQEIGKASFDKLTDKEVTLTTPLEEKEGGQEMNLKIDKQGAGQLYYTARLQYLLQKPALKAVNAGLEIKREYSRLQDNQWVLLKEGTSLKRGDLVRVDLYVMLPGDRTFVVVNDPLPGCLEAVNKNLATASVLDQQQIDQPPAKEAWWHQITQWTDFDTGRWSFYHQEIRHDSVRFYADYLPRGNYYLNYVAQVIADGEFLSPSSVAQEMYTPETYGKGEASHLTVKAAS